MRTSTEFVEYKARVVLRNEGFLDSTVILQEMRVAMKGVASRSSPPLTPLSPWWVSRPLFRARGSLYHPVRYPGHSVTGQP
ncbi:hypothetical protein E2C01_042663 [Portunus trituberculatus]|uniref:Uncharacterized protein n=1 Tax=Portunus trituberculatus TaxID=210409 RepID=A0A5B7FU06_PORTR|nr:hypothetical protein [Portunus trituberculatus]